MAGPARTRYRYDVFLSHSNADKPVVREPSPIRGTHRGSPLLEFLDVPCGEHVTVGLSPPSFRSSGPGSRRSPGGCWLPG
jgi:hypothetical protein